MKLKAKITDDHLDKILSGEKITEFRQLESIELTSESGRKYTLEIKDVDNVTPPGLKYLEIRYPDIPWDDNLPTIMMALGDIIQENSK